MFPIIFTLFVKTYYGVRWFTKWYSRPYFQSYFRVSWSFYTAYEIQTSFILAATWDVFNRTIRGFTIFALIACPIVFIFMRAHMKYIDQQSFKMNELRKNI